MNGVGLGWRPETAWLIDTRSSLAFTEVIAENVEPRRPPPALAAAVARGLPVIAHGVGLSLGGARRPDRARLRRLAAVARALRSPLVSEHVAFCRAGDLASPHFLPVPHTRAQLAVLVDHVRWAIDALPVPLALENVAAPLRWPGDELAEADFLAELLARTGARLLLDVANLHANLVNHGGELARYLDRLPLDRVAYVHVAGGARVDVLWRDTHAHPIAPAMLATLDAVLARTGPLPLLLERDHAYGTRADLERELDTLADHHARAAGDVLPARAVPRTALPAVDRACRADLEAAHRALLAGVLRDALDAPLPGFDPTHVAETRAIVRGKTARGRAPGAQVS